VAPQTQQLELKLLAPKMALTPQQHSVTACAESTNDGAQPIMLMDAQALDFSLK